MRALLIQLARLLVTLPAALAMTAMAAPGTKNDLQENGQKLIADAKCEGCHTTKVGGDGSAIYLRKERRVTTKSKLLPQVERCNRELGLGLFPEDEAAIATYLNATHYKFKE